MLFKAICVSVIACGLVQSTTTCKGNEDPAKCTSKYTGKCKDADLGDLVQSLCPVMCGTCPELTATETAEDRARRASLNTAAITTNDGSIDIQSKSGKDICFSEAGQPKTCIKELAVSAAVDKVMANMRSILMEEITGLKANTTQDIKGLKATVYADFQGQLKALMANDCGRHCEPGNYASTPCVEKPDGSIQKTVCSKCAGATFSHGGLVPSCTTCTKCADQNAYLTGKCAATKDTACKTCTACPKGTWAKGQCTDGSTKHCVKHTSCDKAAFMTSPGTATADTQCKKCKLCLPGLQYAGAACSATKDAVCNICAVCTSSQIVGAKCSRTENTKCLTPKSCHDIPTTAASKEYNFAGPLGKAFCFADSKIGGGGKGWTLGLNIHPSDGHNAAWSADPNPKKTMNVGDKPPWPRGKCCWWTCDSNYEPRGSVKPFGKDYKSQRVYKNVKVEEIMIVRHLDGKPHMWKTWKVYNQYKGKTLLWLFQNTYRTRVAAALKGDKMGRTDYALDPIFGYGGNMYLNYYYSNNGARIALDGQSMSGQDSNDDSTFGLGMEFASHQGRTRYSGSSGDWCFDVSWHESRGGCPSAGCGMGKDKCKNLNNGNNQWLGEYAIWVR